MQAPTHLLTGVLIQKMARKWCPLSDRRLPVASLAVLSHGILDRLARLTYHPPAPLSGDWFWVSYHLAITSMAICTSIKHWRTYKLGLICSILPDLDWLFLHTSNSLSFQIPLWKEPVLHKLLLSHIDSLPLLGSLNSLPDWTQDRKGVILELALLAMLVTLVHSPRKLNETTSNGK